MITSTIDVTGLDGDSVNLKAGALDELRERVEGPLLRPGDDGWDDAVPIWNATRRASRRSSCSRPRPATWPRPFASPGTAGCS